MLYKFEKRMATQLIKQLGSNFCFDDIGWEGADNHAYYFTAFDENGISLELKETKSSDTYMDNEVWYKYNDDWYYADHLS